MFSRFLILVALLGLLPEPASADPIVLWAVNYRTEQIRPPALVGYRFIDGGLLPANDSLSAKFTNVVAGECQATGQDFAGMAIDLSSNSPVDWRIVGPISVGCIPRGTGNNDRVATFNSAAVDASIVTWRNRIATLSPILGQDALASYLLSAAYQQLRTNDCAVVTTSSSDPLLPNFSIPICFHDGKLVGGAFFLEVGEKFGLTRLKSILSHALGDSAEVSKAIAFQIKALFMLTGGDPASWPPTFASTEFKTQNAWGGNCSIQATSPPGANIYQAGARFVRQPEFRVYCQAPRGALFFDSAIAPTLNTDWRIQINERGPDLVLQKFKIPSALRLKSLSGATPASYMRLTSKKSELYLHLEGSSPPTLTQQNDSTATVENGEICESVEGQIGIERVQFQTRNNSSACVSLPSKITFKAIRFEEADSTYSCDYWLDVGRPFWIRLQRIVDPNDGTTIGDRFGPQDNPNNFKVRIPDCTDSLLSRITATASIMIGSTEAPLCMPLAKPTAN